MQLVATATLALALGPAALAADVDRVVAAGFARFEQACTAAVTDPQSYVSAIPNPGPLGNKTVSVSPDGQVIYVNHSKNGFGEYVHFMRLPNSLTVFCVVHNEPGDEAESYLNFTTREAFDQHSRELAAALERYVSTRQDITMVGGQVPIEYAAQFNGTVHRMNFPFNYQYAYHLAAGEHSLPSLIEIGDAALTFHTTRRIEVAQ